MDRSLPCREILVLIAKLLLCLCFTIPSESVKASSSISFPQLDTMGKTDMELEHVEEGVVQTTEDNNKNQIYQGNLGTGSHHKSKFKRRLVLKADLVILPLCALTYFVAYLVRTIPSVRVTSTS